MRYILFFLFIAAISIETRAGMVEKKTSRMPASTELKNLNASACQSYEAVKFKCGRKNKTSVIQVFGEDHRNPKDVAFKDKLIKNARDKKIILGLEGIPANFKAAESSGVFGIEDEPLYAHVNAMTYFYYFASEAVDRSPSAIEFVNSNRDSIPFLLLLPTLAKGFQKMKRPLEDPMAEILTTLLMTTFKASGWRPLSDLQMSTLLQNAIWQNDSAIREMFRALNSQVLKMLITAKVLNSGDVLKAKGVMANNIESWRAFTEEVATKKRSVAMAGNVGALYCGQKGSTQIWINTGMLFSRSIFCSIQKGNPGLAVKYYGD